MPGPAAARRPRPVAAHAGICVTRLRVGGSRSGECSKSGISPCDSARGVEAAEAEAGGGGGGAARRGRGGEGVHGGGAAASARAPGDRGAAAAAPATEGAPSGLAGGKQRRVGTGGGEPESVPTTFPSPLDGRGGVRAAAAVCGGRAGGRHFGVGVEQPSGESAPRPLAEYVPTRCLPSAGRVCARAAAGELGAVEARGGHWGADEAGVQGSGPSVAAARRTGCYRAPVGDSRTNSVHGGSEKRRCKAAGLTCEVPLQESRGCRVLSNPAGVIAWSNGGVAW